MSDLFISSWDSFYMAVSLCIIAGAFVGAAAMYQYQKHEDEIIRWFLG